LVGKRSGKIPRDRPSFEVENRIKIFLKGAGWEGVTWIHLSQDEEDQERARSDETSGCVKFGIFPD
jgi:hypothetical protein